MGIKNIDGKFFNFCLGVDYIANYWFGTMGTERSLVLFFNDGIASNLLTGIIADRWINAEKLYER
jgi:hypothetical protein